MGDEFKIKKITSVTGDNWDNFYLIYEENFPEWERVPTADIKKGLEQGIYRLELMLKKDLPVGILFLLSFGDGLFTSYVAVKKEEQGNKIGERICRNVISEFAQMEESDYLFLEAEERQARYYERFGYKTVNIGFMSPCYGSDSEEVPMSLMFINKNGFKLTKEKLEEIITKLYLEDYDLDCSDNRYLRQMARIPETNDITLN